MAKVKFVKGNITGTNSTYLRLETGNIEFDSNKRQILLDGVSYGESIPLLTDTRTSADATITTSTSQINQLYDGARVSIRLVYNTAASTKLNLTLSDGTTTGAKPIYVVSATSNIAQMAASQGKAGMILDLVYDSTNNRWTQVGNVDKNTTYSNVSLGNGYATQNNSSASDAVIATLSSYSLATNGRVSVKFNYDVPASATLNINSRGAKPIYYNGAAIEAGTLKSGDIATFVYDGTNYQLVNKYISDLTFDTVPTENSTNPVTSGGLYTVITNNEEVISAALNDLNDRKVNTTDLATVATSGSYNDLTDKPTIPNLTKGTTTGSGNAVTDISVSGHLITLTKGTTFLTTHQDISGKANITSPTFTGVPKAPTAATGTNTTQIATTAFVQLALSNFDDEIFIPVSALPTSDIKTNKIYIVPNSLAEPENNLYNEYLYKDGAWELIGTSLIDLNSKEDKWTIELYTGSNIFPTNPYNTIYVLNGKYYHCSLNATVGCEWRSLDGQNYINYNKANSKWDSGRVDNITAYDVNVTSRDEVRNIWESGDDLDSTLHNIVDNINSLDSSKQKLLVSGTDIKTINSTSLLGSGNITVLPTLVSGTNIKTLNGLSLLGSGNIELDGDDILYNGEGTGTYNPGVTSIDDCIDDLDARIITLSTPASGTTANRPSTNLTIGQQYFDTTLGVPIWWNGTKWVDALGNNISNNINYVYTIN